MQHPVHRQFAEHDYLLNAEQGIALRPVDEPGQITGHDARRRQGFAGMHQKGFVIDGGVDEENRAGFAHRLTDLGSR